MERSRSDHGTSLRLSEAARQSARWRAKRRRGEWIPESLWRWALEFVAEYGASRTPSLLRLDYCGLPLRRQTSVRRQLFLLGKSNCHLTNKDGSPSKGLYTSGIVSTSGGRRIALCFSGRQHAGENLADVLRERDEELSAPIQMCDALSRNLPEPLATMLAHCLSHARRDSAELANRFREECWYIRQQLVIVYAFDQQAKAGQLSPEDRLALHQDRSGPVMQALKAWGEQQFAKRRREPNSSLGSAMTYLLKHWEPLTL